MIDAIESGDGGSLAAHIANMTVHITNTERQTWDAKQDALIAGNNIQIANDGKTISATDTVYNDSAVRGLITAEATARGNADDALNSRIDALGSGGGAGVYRGTSGTSPGSIAAKVVNCPGFVRQTGSIVVVAFGARNTAANPTLNVENTGAAFIKVNASNIIPGMLGIADSVFQFDGSAWQLLNPVFHEVMYGWSSTAASTAEKYVACADDGYQWERGRLLCVIFSNANTAQAPTLRVEGGGAARVIRCGANVIDPGMLSNQTHIFVSDGDGFQLLNPAASSGGGGGAYLPTAGGTMTGAIAFSDPNSTHITTGVNVSGGITATTDISTQAGTISGARLNGTSLTVNRLRIGDLTPTSRPTVAGDWAIAVNAVSGGTTTELSFSQYDGSAWVEKKKLLSDGSWA